MRQRCPRHRIGRPGGEEGALALWGAFAVVLSAYGLLRTVLRESIRRADD